MIDVETQTVPLGLSIEFVENGWIVNERFHHPGNIGRQWIASTPDDLAALIKRYGERRLEVIRPMSAI